MFTLEVLQALEIGGPSVLTSAVINLDARLSALEAAQADAATPSFSSSSADPSTDGTAAPHFESSTANQVETPMPLAVTEPTSDSSRSAPSITSEWEQAVERMQSALCSMQQLMSELLTRSG